MKFSLFWDVTQRRLVVYYRRFGTTYRSNLQVPSNPSRLSQTVSDKLPIYAV